MVARVRRALQDCLGRLALLERMVLRGLLGLLELVQQVQQGQRGPVQRVPQGPQGPQALVPLEGRVPLEARVRRVKQGQRVTRVPLE